MEGAPRAGEVAAKGHSHSILCSLHITPSLHSISCPIDWNICQSISSENKPSDFQISQRHLSAGCLYFPCLLIVTSEADMLTLPSQSLMQTHRSLFPPPCPVSNCSPYTLQNHVLVCWHLPFPLSLYSSLSHSFTVFVAIS